MTDLLLMVLIGVLVLALGVDIGVLVGFLKQRGGKQ
jgi:hypothetical protein